jgi:hypothetical protein
MEYHINIMINQTQTIDGKERDNDHQKNDQAESHP